MQLNNDDLPVDVRQQEAVERLNALLDEIERELELARGVRREPAAVPWLRVVE
jgi:hypothetical protein